MALLFLICFLDEAVEMLSEESMACYANYVLVKKTFYNVLCSSCLFMPV